MIDWRPATLTFPNVFVACRKNMGRVYILNFLKCEKRAQFAPRNPSVRTPFLLGRVGGSVFKFA